MRRLHVRDDSIDVLKDLLTHNTPYSADIYATIARAFSQQGKADEARSLLKAMNRYEFWGPPSRSSRREQPLASVNSRRSKGSPRPCRA
ncbi:MAG: tetratricopeptide repeat protein [Brevundimonas sp.]|nr:MAG: tetratricopeptide repeat protein [Brevundimonas sp.]